MKNLLSDLEFITLNIASLGWVIGDVVLNKTPNWVSIGVGLSIIFFNVARGIAVLNRNKNKGDE